MPETVSASILQLTLSAQRSPSLNLNSVYMNMTKTSFTAEKLWQLMSAGESFTSEDRVPPIKVTAEVSFEDSIFFFFFLVPYYLR